MEPALRVLSGRGRIDGTVRGPGRRVAVIGRGPVGLMAAVAAREAGADEVYALDLVEERLEFARSFGVTPVLASVESALPVGVDASLEPVGCPPLTQPAAWTSHPLRSRTGTGGSSRWSRTRRWTFGR